RGRGLAEVPAHPARLDPQDAGDELEVAAPLLAQRLHVAVVPRQPRWVGVVAVPPGATGEEVVRPALVPGGGDGTDQRVQVPREVAGELEVARGEVRRPGHDRPPVMLSGDQGPARDALVAEARAHGA